MLQRAKELSGYTLGARDGEIGKVSEFYFDDHNWTVRYLVADTGGWLSGRQVLISPYALDPADKGRKVIPVELTRAQIEKSPALATDRSRGSMKGIITLIMAGQGTGAALTLGDSAPILCAGQRGGRKHLVSTETRILISAAPRQ
jgi:hypothetical protein